MAKQKWAFKIFHLFLIIGGAERHHYSTFGVGRSMLDVHFFSKRTTKSAPTI